MPLYSPGVGATVETSELSEVSTFAKTLLDDTDAATARNTLGTSGRELGYAEITSDFTTTSTSAVDVTGLDALAVTVGSRPILVLFSTRGLDNNTLNGNVSLNITEDGTIVGTVAFNGQAANARASVYRSIRRAPSAGSHTYKAQLLVASGTGAIRASATSPTSLHVIEI